MFVVGNPRPMARLRSVMWLLNDVPRFARAAPGRIACARAGGGGGLLCCDCAHAALAGGRTARFFKEGLGLPVEEMDGRCVCAWFARARATDALL